MKRSIQIAMSMGLCLALATGAGGCELSLGEQPCGEGWCPDTMVCVGASRCVFQSICGNTVLDPGEECDDGNTRDGDGCSSDCKFELCGNGVVDDGEQCDGGPTETASCNIDCTHARCGDGHVNQQAGEMCDDGNTRDGDGCSRDCQSTEVCGNGFLDIAQGEVCDDGNTRDGDGCSSDCKSTEICGNGILDVAVGEVCDDGARNGTPGDPCSADCRHFQPCNDGIVGPGEECDHGGFSPGNPTGNDNSNDCRADCQFNRCGDGFIDTQPGSRQEECDDGHLTGLIPHPTETFRCNIDCTRARCGDGKVNQAAGEQCDDGNIRDGDGCSSTCQIEH